ncbi:hypothetical protein AX16_010166 [Volvariella volvacea WC 439]|nr:hypothetical protein AX16_010166 [Volvariella volvacea WC 439]
MSTDRKLILVTGVTGFLGSHVAVALFNAGYAVRGTVRGSRLESLRTKLGSNYPHLELVQVDDIVSGDFTEALKGVDGVIHVASPMPGTASNAEILNGALEGTLNILRQATKAGVQKVVLTGTEGATRTPSDTNFAGKIFTEADWGLVTKENVLSEIYSQNPLGAYFASKILAEKAAWEFAEQNPALDLAVINPPFLYGPYAPHFPVPANAGTVSWIYSLIQGKQPPPVPPNFADIRDAARAHVAALDLAPLAIPERNQQTLQQKRFLVSNGTLTWKEALLLLHDKRPQLKDRLLAKDTYGDSDPQRDISFSDDVRRAERELGFGKGKSEWISWEKCVLDTVDSLLESEKH